MNNQETIKKLEKLENELILNAAEIKNVFFKNERYFDNKHRFDRMMLDNPPFSFGSFGELSRSFDAENWHGEDTFEDCLKYTFNYYQELNHQCDCEGYGINAMARGFDVTKPIGRIWTLSMKCILILEKMSFITNINLHRIYVAGS